MATIPKTTVVVKFDRDSLRDFTRRFKEFEKRWKAMLEARDAFGNWKPELKQVRPKAKRVRK